MTILLQEMQDHQNRHGWKWIGAPHSGVLGLFPAPEATGIERKDIGSHDKPSHDTSKPVEGVLVDPMGAPLAIRMVFLVMELTVALATGLLCVWCGSLTKSIVRYFTGSGFLAETLYCAVVCYGAVTLMTKLFHQSDRLLLLRRLGLFSSPRSAILLSIVFHSALLTSTLTYQESTTVSTTPDWLTTLSNQATLLSLRSLVLAPLEEELFFRALLFHLALNRLGNVGNSPLPSAIIASVCFALVHLANAKRQDTHTTDLIVQLVWALVVGLLLALRYARRGSLLECVVLHSVNNAFAALFTALVSPTSPGYIAAGGISLAVYSAAGVYEWWLFSRYCYSPS